jgi:hypothetical protein
MNLYKLLSFIGILLGIIPFFLLSKQFYPILILLLAPIVMLSAKLYKKSK